MNTLRSLTTAVALAVAAGACTAHASPRTGPLPAERETTVEVTNNNWSDMVVYVVSSGMRRRLGTINSMSTERLRVPRALVMPGVKVRLMADPIGDSDTFNTGPILVSPGERIEFTIQNHLAISSYAVWPR